MSSSCGKIVDRSYRLHEQLGEGGMGAVYRATQLLTGSQVALKIISHGESSEQLADANHHRNLRLALAREFQTLASLHHPNVIRVLSYGFDEDLGSYFTMELLNAPKTLLDAAVGQLLEGQVLLIVQLLRALIYVHRRGILHRDIKPGNVLVVNGEVKLLDFGIAAAITSDADLAGTLAFMAPELLLGQPPSIKSDLYSVGVLFHWLLAGSFPYSHESLTHMLYELLGEDSDQTFSPAVASFLKGYRSTQTIDPKEAPFPDSEILPEPSAEHERRQLPEDIPAPLRDVVHKLLARRPEERFADASEALQELAAALKISLPVETVETRESFLQATELIGREVELQQLLGALEQAKGGQSTGFLLGGESGIGKSRLLAELRTQALVQEFWVAEGQSTAEGTYLYQEWLPLLRSLCLRVEMTDEEAAILKGLIPEISDLLGRPIPDPPAISPDTAVTHLAKGIVALLRRQPKALLLLFEDLHWGRQESLALLAEIARTSRELPFMLVGTYRSDEKPQLPQMFSTLAVLPLGRLPAQEVARLSESMLGAIGRQAHLVDYLTRQTEGNVFFVVEIVRALAENAGELQRIGQGELPENVLTAGIERIVEQRIHRVPAPYQALLDFSAVLGRQLDLAALSHRFETLPLRDFLIECANAAVLESQGNTYRFAHDKLRETILRRLNKDMHTALHRQVAETLESVYQGQDQESQSAAMALHFQEAGIPDKALHYHLQAGEAALKLYAYTQAHVHFAAAEQALLQLPDTIELLRLHANIMIKQVKCSSLAMPIDLNFKRLGTARKRLQSIMEAGAMEPKDWLCIAQVDYLAGILSMMLGELEQATTFGQKALPIAREYNDLQLVATASNMLAVILVIRGQMREALDLLMPILQDSESILLPAHETAHAQLHLVMSLCAKGRFKSAIPFLVQVQRWEDKFRQSPRAILIQMQRSFCYFYACDWQSTIETCRPLIALTEKLNQQFIHYSLLDILAGSLGRLGQYAEAFAFRARAVELRRHHKGGMFNDQFNAVEAEMLLMAGRTQDALAKAQEVVHTSGPAGLMISLVLAERVFGVALARLGANLSEVEAHLQQSLTRACQTDQIMQALWTELWWGRICRERGDEIGAALHFARAREHMTEEMAPSARAEALHFSDVPHEP
jgi:serine/threonine protein kinase/tetratricopeptide (TPR) repeat protein